MLTTPLNFFILILVTLKDTYCISNSNQSDFSKIFSANNKNHIRLNQELDVELEGVVVGSGNITSLPYQDMEKNSISFGFMADIETFNRTIDLTGFYFYTDTTEVVTYSLFTVEGSYASAKHNLKLWSIIGSGTATSYGIEKPTKVEKIRSISIPAGSTIGIYLTLRSQNLVNLGGESKRGIGEIFLKNNDVAISFGTGIPSYPLGDSFLEPRCWCGFIRYYVIDNATLESSVFPIETSKLSLINSTVPSDAPSLFESAKPDHLPPLVPMGTHSIVPKDSSFSLTFASNTVMPTLYPSTSNSNSMANPSYLPTVLHTSSSPSNAFITFFPEEKLSSSPSKTYITLFPLERMQHLRANQTITLYGTNISLADKSMQLALSNELKTSIQQILTERYEKLLNISNVLTIDQQLVGEEFNEVDILIDAVFDSSKEIDFSIISQSTINELRHTILINLQREGTYFQNVERIVCVTSYDSNKDYVLSTINQSISLQYPNGYSKIMDLKTVIRFEDSIQNFFNTSLSNINTNSYVVMAYVTSTIFTTRDSESFLDLWVTIHVKHAVTSGDFNLSSSIQWIISHNNQQLFYKLKDSEINYFKELKRVDFEKTITSTQSPTTIDEDVLISSSTEDQNSKTFFSSTLGYVVIGISAIVLVVIAILISCFCQPCSKCRKEEDAMIGLIIKGPAFDDPTSANSMPSVSVKGHRDNFYSAVSALPRVNGHRNNSHSAKSAAKPEVNVTSVNVPNVTTRRHSFHSAAPTATPSKQRRRDSLQSSHSAKSAAAPKVDVTSVNVPNVTVPNVKSRRHSFHSAVPTATPNVDVTSVNVPNLTVPNVKSRRHSLNSAVPTATPNKQRRRDNFQSFADCGTRY